MALIGASSLGALSQGSVNDNDTKRYRVGADGSQAIQGTTAADWGYQPINAAGTVLVKSGAGQFYGIILLGGTLGNITVYDSLTASGNVILPTWQPPALASSYFLAVNAGFATGLTIVTAAATVLTVLAR